MDNLLNLDNTVAASQPCSRFPGLLDGAAATHSLRMGINRVVWGYIVMKNRLVKSTCAVADLIGRRGDIHVC